MSSLWLRCITSFCLIFAALRRTESSGVVWRKAGGQITIECRYSQSDQNSLTLFKGLNKTSQVMHKVGGKDTIDQQFTSRLQLNGAMPNVSILITNLTSGDTGPYWCMYNKYDKQSSSVKATEGKGSVLLVVTDSPSQRCDQADKTLIVGSVVISAAVLFGIILAFFIWIIHKGKSSGSYVNQRRVPTNDVYEDMRGTLRR